MYYTGFLSKMYAQGDRRYLWRYGQDFLTSTDNGSTLSNESFENAYVEDFLYAGEDAMFMKLLSNNYQYPDRIMHSTDNGSSWEKVGDFTRVLDWVRVPNDTLLILTPEGIEKYSIQSGTITHIDPGLPLTGFTYDYEFRALLGFSNGIRWSTDNGMTWWDDWHLMEGYSVREVYSNYFSMYIVTNDTIYSFIRNGGALREMYTGLNLTYKRVSVASNREEHRVYVIKDYIINCTGSTDTLDLAFQHEDEVVHSAFLDHENTWHIISNRGYYYTCNEDGSDMTYVSWPAYFLGYGSTVIIDEDEYCFFREKEILTSRSNGAAWDKTLVGKDVHRTTHYWDGHIYGLVFDPDTCNLVEFDPTAGTVTNIAGFTPLYEGLYLDDNSGTFLTFSRPQNSSSYDAINLSTDKGQSWSRIQGPDSTIIDVAYSVKTGVLCAGQNKTGLPRRLYIYDSSGAVWNDFTPAQDRFFHDSSRFHSGMRIDDAGNIILAGASWIFRSTDIGRSWDYVEKASVTGNFELLLDMYIDGTILTMNDRPQLDRREVCLYNFDTGMRQLVDLDGVYGDVWDAKFDPSGYLYIATNFGLFKSNVNVVSGIQRPDNEFSFSLSQNYPNPISSAEPTTIPFDLPHGGDAVLTVYDIHGRVVERRSFTGMQPGGHSATLDMAGRLAGVYIYTLSSGGAVQGRKMVVVR